MSQRKKPSPFIRAISGVIGILGFAAIAFNTSRGGDIELDFMLVASFFAGFVFLFVAFFGKYPWDREGSEK